MAEKTQNAAVKPVERVVQETTHFRSAKNQMDASTTTELAARLSMMAVKHQLALRMAVLITIAVAWTVL